MFNKEEVGGGYLINIGECFIAQHFVKRENYVLYLTFL